MSRMQFAENISAAPTASHAALQGVEQMLGSVPNLFRLLANSPQTLDGYLGLFGALSKGQLDGATRERIAIAIAQMNGCNYCLSAHSYLAKNVAKLDDAEIVRNRDGASSDKKAGAAVRFASQVAKAHGRVSDAELAEVRSAGFSEAAIIEIVGHVALNTLSNYMNEVAKTTVDFPAPPQR
jgi:uncharacterized peroxidase-related enzyme